ncbi:HAMP domain-containing histidine kinase [Pseudonocardia sp. RS11V-5]|uniref:sensor histidine kinase n=1 Tax=Pseudonocardia terrae TaxID=2905831 RepID=UPI001E36C75A|nr:HAMP domain-containing sensor histidine kinase [Pseudonocardia terrae]MCE3551019.1 HAMP domain-containing histidine kinase [Pseudonocardia terrae]
MRRADRGRPGPVRRRLVVLTLVTAAIAVGLFGIPLAVGLVQYSLEDQESVLQRTASLTARSVQSELAHGDAPTVLPDLPADVVLGVYDGDRDLVLGDGPEPAGDEIGRALDGRGSHATVDGTIVVTVPVTGRHGPDGAVRAAMPVSAVYAGLVPVWLAMAGLAAAVLVTVWRLARRQARRLATPLEDLAGAARRLGEGDFSVRTGRAGVAEIDEVGGALDSTAERLDALLARERAFSQDASHQLRTPLTGLRLRLEAALDRPDADLKAALVAGIAEADRLERTIDELLQLARERTGRSGPTDVGALVRELEPARAERLAASGRGLVLDVAAALPPAAASGAAIRQILGVLLDNAEVHGSGTVRIVVRESGEALAVDVTDEGAGPGPDPFAAPPERRAAGHGIGLPLARRLAEAEGGRLVLSRAVPPVFTLFVAATWPDPAVEDGPDTATGSEPLDELSLGR